MQFAEAAQAWALAACYAMTVYYKVFTKTGGGVVFLFMTCHLLVVAMLAVRAMQALAFPATEFTRRLSFVAAMHGFAGLLPLATPDLTPLRNDFEIPHFFAYHVLMVTLPITWLLLGRMPIYAGWRPIAGAYLLNAFFNAGLVQLLCVTVAGGLNIGYNMMPPGIVTKIMGGDPDFVKAYFREVFGVVLLPIFVTLYRMLLLGTFIYLTTEALPQGDAAKGAKRLGEEDEKREEKGSATPTTFIGAGSAFGSDAEQTRKEKKRR